MTKDGHSRQSQLIQRLNRHKENNLTNRRLSRAVSRPTIRARTHTIATHNMPNTISNTCIKRAIRHRNSVSNPNMFSASTTRLKVSTRRIIMRRLPNHQSVSKVRPITPARNRPTIQNRPPMRRRILNISRRLLSSSHLLLLTR